MFASCGSNGGQQSGTIQNSLSGVAGSRNEYLFKTIWPAGKDTFSSTQSTEMEAIHYNSFYTKPNNLSITDCGNLLKGICKEFLDFNHHKKFVNSNYSTHKLIEENEKVWIFDFLVYITIILVMSMAISWMFFRIINIAETKPPIEENLEIVSDNIDESTQTVTPLKQDFDFNQTDEVTEDFSMSFRNDSMEVQQSIHKTEAFLDTSNSSGGSVSAITSIYENLSSTASSGPTPLKTNKKIAKNFLNINMKKIKQKSDMISQSTRLCRSEEALKSRQKSAIPVRTIKLGAKKTDEGKKNASKC